MDEISTITVNSLLINQDKTLTINSLRSLTITNELANNGALIIKSDASGTGSLKHLNTGVNATVERFIPAANWANNVDGWHLISSPVVNQSISGSWTPDGTNDNDYDFYEWLENDEEYPWMNQKANIGVMTNFNSGKGYLVSYQQASTNFFLGELHSGNIPVGLLNSTQTKSSKEWGFAYGWNLIGNPYPSGIDWNLANREKFADEFAYLLNSDAIGDNKYIPLDGDVAGAFIAPHQGFFVIAATTSHNKEFVFTDELRVHNGEFLKNNATADKFILRLSDENGSDETIIRIKPQANPNRDRKDALKLSGFNLVTPEVNTLTADDVKVAINSFGSLDEIGLIPIEIRVSTNGACKIELVEQTGNFENSDVYLRDNLTGTTTNLTQLSAYSFSSEPGNVLSRFSISLSALGIEESELSRIQVYTVSSTINISNTPSNAQITLSTLTGQVVMQRNTGGSGLVTLNAASLPKGVYIVTVQGEGARVSRKVVL